MPDMTSAILSSWTIEFWPLTLSLLSIAVYWRGWRGLSRSMPAKFPVWRLVSFITGISSCWIAIASPLDAFGSLLLQVHMTQHVLLMMVGPPLILLACPGIPMLRGLPHTIRRDWLGPFLGSHAVRAGFHRLTHPMVGLTLFIAATWIWHLPTFYELALRNTTWHEIEHLIFLLTALLFWWPIVQPWPSTPTWPRWLLLPYLLVADLQNTLFSAVYVFRETPIYNTYAATPELLGFSTMQDQAAAGAIMWVAGSAVFLIPVGLIIKQLLQPQLAIVGVPGSHSRGSVSLPILGQQLAPASREKSNDLLRIPLIGRLLRSLRFRRCVQWIMFGLAALIVVDGLFGPRLGPMNLAGVLPWTHWRGFVVIALLVAGNAFCWACPFMLPRELSKRFFRPTRRWPRAIRSKWLAASLLLVYLWAYEVYGLWDSPWWTAWVVIGYFAAAFTVDAFFRGAAFCRWVCPIGQFHFVESLVSPREVAALDAITCNNCTTKDCIRGGPGGRGCELDLYLPTKRGNLDCTWCMDCVRACPHDNVGITTRSLQQDASFPGWRGSIGRISTRPDIAALAALLTFGAFANALGMVGPVLDLEDQFASSIGAATPVIPASMVLIGVAVLAPLIVLPLIAAAVNLIGRSSGSLVATTSRLSLCLVPIGFAMWLVHMLFHLLTSLGTIVPVSQRLAADAGINLGDPAWVMACCLNVPTWLLPIEFLLLDAGLILTVITVHRMAANTCKRAVVRCTVLLSMPAVILFAIGVWIVLQPMQMRGTLLP